MRLSLGEDSTESLSGLLSQQGSQMQETNLILEFCFLSLLVLSEAVTEMRSQPRGRGPPTLTGDGFLVPVSRPQRTESAGGGTRWLNSCF